MATVAIDDKYEIGAQSNKSNQKAAGHEKLAIELDDMIRRLEEIQIESLLEVEINHLQCQVVIFKDEAIRQREKANELRSRI